MSESIKETTERLSLENLLMAKAILGAREDELFIDATRRVMQDRRELLAACESAIDATERPRPLNHDEFNQLWDGVLVQLKAAIAKAKGQP